MQILRLLYWTIAIIGLHSTVGVIRTIIISVIIIIASLFPLSFGLFTLVDVCLLCSMFSVVLIDYQEWLCCFVKHMFCIWLLYFVGLKT